jgi:DNA polymerase phi
MGSKRKRSAKEGAAFAEFKQKRPRPTEDAQTSAKELLKEKLPFPLNPTNDDRKREARLYDILGSEDSEERLAAADAIVFGLLHDGGVPQTDLYRHLDRRLFRGLASGRKGSRLGFSLVLTELLSQLYGSSKLAETKYPDLPFEKVFNQLLENTRPRGNIPGQEEKDHYLGQLFGIQSFVRAGVCVSSELRWPMVLDVILKLAQLKPWIRSQCGWLVLEAVPQMTQETAEITLQSLSEQKLVKTSDGVGIWMSVIKRFPGLRLPAKTWQDPLATKNLSDLALAIRDSGRESDPEAAAGSLRTKQANWTAQLHFIWDLISQHYQALARSDDKEASEQFKLFWNRVVDGELIHSVFGA